MGCTYNNIPITLIHPVVSVGQGGRGTKVVEHPVYVSIYIIRHFFSIYIVAIE